MYLKTTLTFIFLFCFLWYLVLPISAVAQPTEDQQSIQTLPQVTLPPPPELPGTIPQTTEDGSIVIPVDQIQKPTVTDVDSFKKEGSINVEDIDLDNIKPPPVPKELLEPEIPSSKKPEIDINEPAEPRELPKAEDKPWFISWWFITLLIFFIAGIVIFLFQGTNSDKKKENLFLSNKQKR